MCGRFVDFLSDEELQGAFDLTVIVEEAQFPPRYNIAPTQPVRIVHPLPADAGHAPGSRGLAVARWGLVPPWAKAPGGATFNARIESVADKPSFRAAFSKRRCLIPANGYYEWQTTEAGKTPYYIHPATPGEPVVFAGLYEWWRDPADASPWLLSATIVTTAARGPVRDLHDRQPVMLTPEHQAAWMDPAMPASDLYGIAAESSPDLNWHAVSAAVGNVRNDGPELIAPAP